MFARVTRVRLVPNADTQKAIQLWREAVLPVLRTQPGFRGVVVMPPSAGDQAMKAMSLTFWDTRENCDAAGESSALQQSMGQLMAMIAGPPEFETYQVGLDERV